MLNLKSISILSTKQLAKYYSLTSWMRKSCEIGNEMVKRPFGYRDKPITQVSTKAWYKALKRAGIDNFRWHDLRHTWASWLAQGGVPLNVIQEMGAWQSTEMVRRYAHLAPEKFGKHAAVVDNMLYGTNTAQNC